MIPKGSKLKHLCCLFSQLFPLINTFSLFLAFSVISVLIILPRPIQLKHYKSLLYHNALFADLLCPLFFLILSHSLSSFGLYNSYTGTGCVFPVFTVLCWRSWMIHHVRFLLQSGPCSSTVLISAPFSMHDWTETLQELLCCEADRQTC